MAVLAWCGMAATAQNTFTFSGVVKDSHGKGIRGVVVNNGVAFTTTDKQGHYALATDTMVSKFVYISTPAEYELPQRDGLAAFYIPVAEAVKTASNDFTLHRRKSVNNRFTYLAISDPQVLNDEEMKRWSAETVKDIRHTADSLRGRGDVVSMTLGDLVFDTPELFPQYAASCQHTGTVFFQTIGNHDFDKQFEDLHNTRLGGISAEHNYFRFFGPTDYSFNIGKVHVVTMKNIDYFGDRKYTEAVNDQQLSWLENDLKYVPKGTTVFLNMHAAGWNKDDNNGNFRNARRIVEILKDYQVHQFCGHTHFFQNILVTDSFYQHNIGAACGAWWGGDVSQCGAPNGYLIVDVNGDEVSWHFKPTKGSINEQIRLYKPGEFRRAKNYLVANVWDYDPACRVVYSEDGIDRGPMEQFTAVDEAYIRQQNAQFKDPNNKAVTSHLFRCIPSKDAHSITVTFTNRFGEKYTATVLLE